MDGKEKDNPLSLKVMRLMRPSLFTGIAVGCDARDLPGDYLNADIRSDIAIPQGLPNTGVGHILLLPQSFGNIYLGETFSCCICVHNNTENVVQGVTIKAVLQISNQRMPLLGEGEDAVTHQLEGNGTINEIIHHEVKDIGTHILVCAISCHGLSGEQQSFRKFFKFQVMKPLDVKTKFYNAESDEVYLEAGVQNITAGPIYMEKVELEPSSYFSVTPLNTTCDGKCTSVFGEIDVLNPMEIRQYLYCLRPRAEARNDLIALKQAASIGKLDMVWRTNMGDKGHLQTSQLQRMVPQYGDVRVVVAEIPSVVGLEEVFNIVLTVSNICDHSLKLHLDFISGGGGTEWYGAVSRKLDDLPPGKSTNIHLSLLPLHLGLQTIAGVKLTDTFLNRGYEYENLAQVFVTNKASVEKKNFFSSWTNNLL